LDVVVMAGGRGSRLGGLKKPFLKVCGKRLIDIAVEVAKGVKERRKVYICLRAEDVHNVEDSDDIEVVICPGAGYVYDLDFILNKVSFPVLILPSDMPFLSIGIVEEFLAKAIKCEADVVTLMVCRDSVCRESGISFFRRSSGNWMNIYFEEVKELRDIDTYEDLEWAREICVSMEEIEKRE